MLSSRHVRPLVVLALTLTACGAPKTPSAAAPAADAAASEEAPAYSAMRTQTGVLIISNFPGAYFTLALDGTQLGSVDDAETPTFVIDNQIFSVNVVPAATFADAPAIKGADGDLLSKHMSWEATHIEDTLREKGMLASELQIHVEHPAGPHGEPMLLWVANIGKATGVPDDDKQAVRLQISLTTEHQGNVVSLNTYLTGQDDIGVGVWRLMHHMETIAFADAPIDLEALQAKLRAAPPADKQPSLEQTVAACEKGIAQACADAGFRYFLGERGAVRDVPKARQFLERGCTAEDVQACFGLGVTICMDKGPAHDPERAKALFLKACQAGIQPACQVKPSDPCEGM